MGRASPGGGRGSSSTPPHGGVRGRFLRSPQGSSWVVPLLFLAGEFLQLGQGSGSLPTAYHAPPGAHGPGLAQPAGGGAQNLGLRPYPSTNANPSSLPVYGATIKPSPKPRGRPRRAPRAEAAEMPRMFLQSAPATFEPGALEGAYPRHEGWGEWPQYGAPVGVPGPAAWPQQQGGGGGFPAMGVGGGGVPGGVPGGAYVMADGAGAGMGGYGGGADQASAAWQQQQAAQYPPPPGGVKYPPYQNGAPFVGVGPAEPPLEGGWQQGAETMAPPPHITSLHGGGAGQGGIPTLNPPNPAVWAYQLAQLSAGLRTAPVEADVEMSAEDITPPRPPPRAASFASALELLSSDDVVRGGRAKEAGGLYWREASGSPDVDDFSALIFDNMDEGLLAPSPHPPFCGQNMVFADDAHYSSFESPPPPTPPHDAQELSAPPHAAHDGALEERVVLLGGGGGGGGDALLPRNATRAMLDSAVRSVARKLEVTPKLLLDFQRHLFANGGNASTIDKRIYGVIMYNARMHACARAAAAGRASVQDGEEVLSAMREHGVRPSLFTFNKMLELVEGVSSFGRAGLAEGHAVLGRMAEGRVEPDRDTFQRLLAISAWSAIHGTALPEDGYWVLSQMSNCRIRPDAVSMKLLLRVVAGAARQGQADVVDLDRVVMLAEGVVSPHDFEFCELAMGAIAQLVSWGRAGLEEGHKYIERMQAAGINPPVRVYHGLLQAALLSSKRQLSQGGVVHVCEQLYDKMLESHGPSKEVLGTLLTVASKEALHGRVSLVDGFRLISKYKVWDDAKGTLAMRPQPQAILQ